MTDLDTSAYTPAHEAETETTEDEGEEEQVEEAEVERTRFQIPLDTSKEENLQKAIQTLEDKIREDTEFYEQIQELKDLLDHYDARKFLKMYQYECDKCGEVFDTKQGIGVHQKMNPNCNGEDRPWNAEEPSYTRRRVQNDED